MEVVATLTLTRYELKRDYMIGLNPKLDVGPKLHILRYDVSDAALYEIDNKSTKNNVYRECEMNSKYDHDRPLASRVYGKIQSPP
ncbi:hypothetical protein ACOSQ2_020824 [Xanthoceras sorbifolium]